MTQPTKLLYMGNPAISPENLNSADDARRYSDSAGELQCVETLESASGSEKDILPPTALVLERPMQWIAERCPFGERRRHRHSSGESESVNCLH